MMTKEQVDRWNSQFELSAEQIDKYIKWAEALPHKYYGADNNGITIYFPQCSLGHIVKAKRDDGEEIDLTDWDNF